MCCIYYTGESHFNAAQNPHLYFQVLLLSQQFESVRVYVTIATYSIPSNSYCYVMEFSDGIILIHHFAKQCFKALKYALIFKG